MKEYLRDHKMGQYKKQGQMHRGGKKLPKDFFVVKSRLFKFSSFV